MRKISKDAADTPWLLFGLLLTMGGRKVLLRD